MLSKAIFITLNLSFCVDSFVQERLFDVTHHTLQEPLLTNVRVHEFLTMEINQTDLLGFCLQTQSLKFQHFCAHTKFLKIRNSSVEFSEFNIDQFTQYYYTEMTLGAAGIIPYFGQWFLASRVMHLTDQINDVVAGQAKIAEYILSMEQKTSKSTQMKKLVHCLYQAEFSGVLCKDLIAQTILMKYSHLKNNQKIPTLEFTKARVVQIFDSKSSDKIFEVEFSVIETTSVVLVSPANSLFIHKENKNFLLTKRPSIFFAPSTNQTLTLQTSDYSTRKLLVSYNSEFDTTRSLFHDFTICNSLNKIQIFKLKPTNIEVNNKPMKVHGLMSFNALTTRISSNGKICEPVRTLTIHMKATFKYTTNLDDIFKYQNHTFTGDDPVAQFADELYRYFGDMPKFLANAVTFMFHCFLAAGFWWILAGFCALVLFVWMKCFGHSRQSFESGNFFKRMLDKNEKIWNGATANTLKYLTEKLEHTSNDLGKVQIQLKHEAVRVDRIENSQKHNSKAIIAHASQLAAFEDFLRKKFEFEYSLSTVSHSTIQSSRMSSIKSSKTKRSSKNGSHVSSVWVKKEYSLTEDLEVPDVTLYGEVADSDKSWPNLRQRQVEESVSSQDKKTQPPAYSSAKIV